MKTLGRDALLFLIATLVLGTVANLVPGRPHLAWWGKGHEPPRAGVDFQFIDADSANSLRLSLPDVVFVDTRSSAEAAAGKVPGAVPIAFTNIDGSLTPEIEATLRRASAVILYGASDETDVEQLLGQELHRRGLTPPYVLLGGFAAWQAAGNEVGS